MSKRLQVILDEDEYRKVRQAARRQGLTISEWVRRALSEARSKQPATDAKRKLRVVRTAVEHEFPTADMDQMLREIEQGYLDEP